MSVSAPSVACWARDVVFTERARMRLVGYAVVPGADAADPAAVVKRLVLQDRDGGEQRLLPLPGRPERDLPWTLQDGVWPQCAGFAIDLPLADGRLSLHEATWDLYVETTVDGGPPHRERLAAGSVERPDQHTSIRPASDHRFQPYVTISGDLSVVVRGLAGHVEVAEIWVREDTVTLHGELVGAPPTTEPVIARRRDGGEVVAWDTSWEGRRVSARLPLVRLAMSDAARRQSQNWDLFVGAGVRPAVRVAAYCDDVLHKSQVMLFPHCELIAAGQPRLLRPYYTAHNTVAIMSRRADE